MPIYDYLCDHCGSFSVLRPIDQRDAGCRCPTCEGDARRAILSAPALSSMTAHARAAHAANERAAHAPRTSAEYQASRHPPGCGCCSSKKSRATVRSADGAKGFPTKRPWMISH